MEKLFELDLSQLPGVHPSRELARDALWVEGSNIRLSEGALRPPLGQFSFIGKLESLPISGMYETIFNGKKILFSGSKDRIHRFVTGTGIGDVSKGSTTYDMDRNELWTFEEHSGNMYGAAPGTQLQRLVDPELTTNFVDVGSAVFASAKIVAKLNAFLIVMNTDISVNGVHWSDNIDGDNFTPTQANDAGVLDIADMQGPINASAPLGNALAVFGSDEMFALTWVGAPLYFRADKLLDGAGAVSASAVTTVGRSLYGFGLRGPWRSDGSIVQYIAPPSIHQEIFSNINLDLLDLAVVWHNPAEFSVAFFWVSRDGTELDTGWAYSIADSTWYPLGYARTAGTSRSIFNFSLLGDSSGNIFQQANPGTTPDPDVVPGDDPTFIPPAGPVSPISLDATFTVQTGYSSIGYGNGGYGGTNSGVG